MNAQPIEADGNLPAALRALDGAVHALCDHQHHYIDNRLLTTPSLYLQLMDAVTGEQVNSGGGRGGKSRPPLWLDAFTLLQEIDIALECWQPAYSGVPATVGRCYWLLQRKWRPQDSRLVEQYAQTIREWAADIDKRLNPPRVSTIAAPCPACGVQFVHRRDDMGETVKMPALQVIADQGCTCQSCRYTWEPSHYMHLCRVLGFDMPTGVLE